MNRSKKSKSKFKGVSWHKRDKRWRAEIKVDGTRIHLGYYVNAIEAVSAYDQAAKKYFGEFAVLNSVPFEVYPTKEERMKIGYSNLRPRTKK